MGVGSLHACYGWRIAIGIAFTKCQCFAVKQRVSEPVALSFRESIGLCERIDQPIKLSQCKPLAVGVAISER